MRAFVLAVALSVSVIFVSPAFANNGHWQNGWGSRGNHSTARVLAPRAGQSWARQPRYAPMRQGQYASRQYYARPYYGPPPRGPSYGSPQSGGAASGLGQVLGMLSPSQGGGAAPPPPPQVIWVAPPPPPAVIVWAAPPPPPPQAVAPIPAEPAEAAEAIAAPPSDAAGIAEVQQRLTARGYYAGPIDGRLDDFTTTALSVFQSDAHLGITGLPDAATMNMLRFGPDLRASIAPLAPPGAIAPPAPIAEAAPVPVAPAYAPPPPAAAPPAAIEPPMVESESLPAPAPRVHPHSSSAGLST